MRIRAFASRKRFLATVCAGLAAFICGASNTSGATQSNPLLFSVSATSTRAIVLESVSMRAEPFSLNSEQNFSPSDPRTRITLFCMNLELLLGEGANSLTADAEDGAHVHYPLKVEYVGQVPGFEGIYMVVLRLNDLMTSNLGDVLVRLNLHGMGSNRVRVGIGQIGGGPTDDNPGVGTPAPTTPPSAVTPLTIAQYQAQFNNASSAAGPDAVRFLEQATWGPTDAELARVRNMGYTAWINDQFSTSPLFSDTQSNYPAQPLFPATSTQGCPTGSAATCVRDNYTMYPLQIQMVKNSVTGSDQLRQRVAFALHQFIVVGGNGVNNGETSWMAPYLQTLDKDVFGNFRNILMDITLNPAMGDYLDMLNNSRAAPNENYAREIMQLFSIGVDRLNSDGTPMLDGQGNRLPSYDQNDITTLARVFTGWTLNANKTWIVDGTTSVPNYIDPMRLNPTSSNSYDLTQKTFTTLAGGFVLPACANCTGGSTAQNLANSQAYKNGELIQVIDALFTHPNTGPYACTQLIHQMVTSNPSPAYVGRCSAAFNSNRSNPTQMQEVIKTILLDPEARGDVKTDQSYGHLREPVLLATNMLRWFNATTDGNLTTSGTRGGLLVNMGQDLFNPPTVFSYYPSDYGLPGAPLFGPEFGILNSQTTLLRSNFINTLFLANNGNGLPVSNPDRPTGTQFSISAYTSMTAQQLVDTLDTKLMHGTTSQSMKNSILTNLNAISSGTLRAQTAIYLFATSAQFQVER